MMRRRIGTHEYIVIYGDIVSPEAVFYVREFGEIKNVTEAAKTPTGWRAEMDSGKVKVFSQRWLEAVFME